MSGIILPPKWTSQPQFPTRLRRDLLPVAGFNAAAGFVDTQGGTFTVGSGLTTTVNRFGKEADFNGSSALTRSVNVSSAYPKTFVAVCRHDTSGVRMLGSLSTSADKPLRVYIESGIAYAQYYGASTNASASVNFLSYGQVGAVVAVFRAQNDVTLYASGNVAKAKSRATTDVGAPTTPTLLAFGAYNGSVVNQYLDGGLGMAAWLGVALSEQEAWSVLDNPWQIFQPLPQRIWVPSVASGAATHATTGALTGQLGSIAGTAAHIAKHATSGALTGPGSALAGVATRFRAHPSSGTLSGPGAAIVGSAARSGSATSHDTSGTLTGPGAALSGVAAHVAIHGTSGALTGPGAAVSGVARHNIPHGASGDLAGPGSSLLGSAFNGVTALTKSGVNRAWLVQYYTKAFAEQEARRKESAPKAVKPKGLTKRVIEAKIQESVTRAEEQLERLAKQARDIQEVQLFVHQAVQQATLAPDPAPVDFMAIAESYRKKLQQEEEELLLLAAVL